MNRFDRRQFLQLASVGGAVLVSGFGGAVRAAGAPATAACDDFFFVELSDSHWGFEGTPNPDAKGTLPKAVAAVNALAQTPDFDDPKKRRKRMGEVRDIRLRAVRAGQDRKRQRHLQDRRRHDQPARALHRVHAQAQAQAQAQASRRSEPC